jgi:hypothetical protein
MWKFFILLELLLFDGQSRRSANVDGPCFEESLILSPLESFCYMCTLLLFWVSLQIDIEQVNLPKDNTTREDVCLRIQAASRLTLVQRGLLVLKMLKNLT